MPTLINKSTGEFSPLDLKLGRLSRLRRRCHAWASVLNGYLQHLGRGYRLAMFTLT